TDVDRPRPAGGGGAPGDGAGERPVDLERAVVVPEPAERAHEPGRQVLLADEVAEQRGRADVGDHRVTDADRRSVAEDDAAGTPPAHRDPHDGMAALERDTDGGRPSYERVGEPARATLGHREAVHLPDTGEQHAEEPARGLVEPEIGVQRVASEQERSTLA